MLVLTHSASNPDYTTITIGDDIEITILETHGDQIRIGIKAPRDICVVRTETASHPKKSRQPGAL